MALSETAGLIPKVHGFVRGVRLFWVDQDKCPEAVVKGLYSTGSCEALYIKQQYVAVATIIQNLGNLMPRINEFGV
jgi:hypothetical protein